MSGCPHNRKKCCKSCKVKVCRIKNKKCKKKCSSSSSSRKKCSSSSSSKYYSSSSSSSSHCKKEKKCKDPCDGGSNTYASLQNNLSQTLLSNGGNSLTFNIINISGNRIVVDQFGNITVSNKGNYLLDMSLYFSLAGNYLIGIYLNGILTYTFATNTSSLTSNIIIPIQQNNTIINIRNASSPDISLLYPGISTSVFIERK